MAVSYVILVLTGLCSAYGAVYYIGYMKSLRWRNQSYAYILQAAELERQEAEYSEKERQRELWLQDHRIFLLDCIITHGNAFGGCSAILDDGTHRMGVVSLDEIVLYGQNPAGQDVSYCIEDQGLEICATDDPNCLKLRSTDQPFEIREANEARDRGRSVSEEMIERDHLYYIILSSKHEISIQALKCS